MNLASHLVYDFLLAFFLKVKLYPVLHELSFYVIVRELSGLYIAGLVTKMLEKVAMNGAKSFHLESFYIPLLGNSQV